ncbi:MAG: glycosyltransferase [Hyphomicrobiaceae bacterium]
MAFILCAFSFGVVLEPLGTWGGFGALLLVPLAGNTALRLMASIEILRRPGMHRKRKLPRMPPHRMPAYTVLVPMFDEPHGVPALVQSLAALDYPRDRLELVLVLEERDAVTRAAVAMLRMPSNLRVVLVPTGGPKTKPKALNYALASVTSELVVVFDAEDRPEPEQLRIAAHAFATGGWDLACVQARLNVYNPDDSFWSRQFALEYSALFDGLLPALDRLRMPIPLGGTSNHFCVSILRSVGAWDPYNVTEDADLGIRLARAGYRTATIASTTWEEAPVDAKVWLGQRTRWLKGWMQTWLVHMRHPIRLLREAGVWQCLGILVTLGGVLLAVLVYPIALGALALAWFLGGFDDVDPTGSRSWLWVVALTNLGAGIIAPMLAAVLAVLRRGRPRLLSSVIWMPAYWIVISIAGYRALVEFMQRPFYWEKTRHGLGGLRKRMLPPPPRPGRTDGPRPSPRAAGHAQRVRRP